MKLNAYAVYDDKAVRFMRPFFINTHGEAIRSFGQSSKDPNSLAATHPGDFKLYYIGTFDDETAKLTTLDTPPVCLAAAIDFVPAPTGSVTVVPPPPARTPGLGHNGKDGVLVK